MGWIEDKAQELIDQGIGHEDSFIDGKDDFERICDALRAAQAQVAQLAEASDSKPEQ